jgi:hypothetical protein
MMLLNPAKEAIIIRLTKNKIMKNSLVAYSLLSTPIFAQLTVTEQFQKI